MTVQITEQRECSIGRAGDWHLTFFDGGERCMLTVNAEGVQFSVHFKAAQWSEFQKLVAS